MDAWKEEQRQVWGDGPEQDAVLQSLVARDAEASAVVRKVLDELGSPEDMIRELTSWALAGQPPSEALARVRARMETNRPYLIRMLTEGYCMGDRPPHTVAQSIVNCLLRGATSGEDCHLDRGK